MSRSKRASIWTEGYGGKWRKHAKKQANKKVRKSKNIASGKAYKKEKESWMICDFKFYDKDKKASRK